MTEVTIGDKVTSLPAYCLYNCKALTSIEIPNSVTSIGKYAFNGCNSLESVVLGDKLPAIGDNAFKGCTSLVKLYSLNPTPPKISASVFDGVDKEACLLMVTKGNLDADTTSIPDFDENIDDHIIVVNYNGVVLYEGPEANMSTLEPGMYVIVKGKESKKLIVK